MTSGFHEGELEVQKLAGVAHDAARLQGMLRPPLLDGGAAKFLKQREFAALTARDRTGLLWISPLHGPAGFLDAEGTTLTVHATPPEGDPLHNLPADQEVGLIVIEFAIRRRVRVNGHLTTASDVLKIEADQAYGTEDRSRPGLRKLPAVHRSGPPGTNRGQHRDGRHRRRAGRGTG